MSVKSKIAVLGVFLLFLLLLATSGGKPSNYTNALKISNAFNGWLWWPTIGCFLVGLGGMRKTKNFTARTYSGTQVQGYIDEGAVKGTDGLIGGISLALAYVSVFMIWVMFSHWGGGQRFPDGIGILAIIVGAFAVIPLFFLFLYLIRMNKMSSWIIGGAWLLFLVIIARL